MKREDLLAKLMVQAVSEGSDIVTLRAIVEETTELAADRVVSRLGLSDADAQDDLDELRELLSAWRQAKASAWKAVVDWIVRGFLALLLIGIAVKMDVGELLR